jgi:hypothetical protein
LTGYFADGARDRSAPGILLAHETPGIIKHIAERGDEDPIVSQDRALFAEEMKKAGAASQRHVLAVSITASPIELSMRSSFQDFLTIATQIAAHGT